MTIKNFTGLVLLLLFCLVSAPSIRTQTNAVSKKSIASEKQSNHEVKKDDNEPPRDGEEWFSRAHRLHNSYRHPESIEAFKRAADLGYRKATAMYNIACGYAMLNDNDNALVWLQRSLDNGFEQTELLASDSDLDPIRTDARFKKLLATVAHGELYVRSEKGYGKFDRLEQANYDYARLERESSQDGDDWAKVGVRMVMLRDFDRSFIALHKAVEYLADRGENAMYNLACAYSLKGDREAGIKWLEKSVNAGFDGNDNLKYDPDLNNLRSDARFPRIEKLHNTLSLSQFFDHGDHSEGDQSEKSHYSKQRWAPAIELYQAFVKAEPNSGRGWFNLGYAFHYSSEHTKAIGAWERALSLGYRKPTSSYNIACAYAMLNQPDAAFEWLDRAVKAGFNSHGDLSWDHDLAEHTFRSSLQNISRSRQRQRKNATQNVEQVVGRSGYAAHLRLVSKRYGNTT